MGHRIDLKTIKNVKWLVDLLLFGHHFGSGRLSSWPTKCDTVSLTGDLKQVANKVELNTT
jgi:hypothetical protein